MFALRACTGSARFIRTYASAPPIPPQDKLILAARKLVEESQREEGSSIEQAKRVREVENVRKALEEVEEGEEVSYS